LAHSTQPNPWTTLCCSHTSTSCNNFLRMLKPRSCGPHFSGTLCYRLRAKTVFEKLCKEVQNTCSKTLILNFPINPHVLFVFNSFYCPFGSLLFVLNNEYFNLREPGHSPCCAMTRVYIDKNLLSIFNMIRLSRGQVFIR